MLGLIGLQSTLQSIDTYTADLTKGHGDFIATDAGHSATTYRSDGFHLLIRRPQTWTPVGLKSPTAHTVLSAEILTTVIRAPADAYVGPFCRKDLDHGYEFVVDAFGHQLLLETDASSSTGVTPLAGAMGRPLTPGHSERLMITCTITGSGNVVLGGYVNGNKIVQATANVVVSEFHYTGFVGHTGDGAPAEWRVTRFWRRGPDDMPNNTPK